jgi:hypothetical protein
LKAVASAARVSGSARRAERLWQIFTLASIAALGYWWFLSRRQVALGWIGMALMILAATLSVRKRLAYQGVFRMSFWLTAHVYLGVVAAVAIFLHTSLRGGGVLTTCLLVLFYLTVGSGVVGWWFARTLPPLLTAIEETPAILEDLLATRADCLKGMLELAEGGSPEFKVLVRGRLMRETTSWGRMMRFYRRRSTLSQELPAFQQEHAEPLEGLKLREQRAYQRAVEYALRVNKMNAELLLQRMLRGWLTFHVVSTGTMFGLAVVHIGTTLYY